MKKQWSVLVAFSVLLGVLLTFFSIFLFNSESYDSYNIENGQLLGIRVVNVGFPSETTTVIVSKGGDGLGERLRNYRDLLSYTAEPDFLLNLMFYSVIVVTITYFVLRKKL